jgi:sirohydrochlorin ferrochelatase
VSDVRIILAAHGSRSEEANSSIAALARGLGERLALNVSPAYLEMAEPTIPAAIAAQAAAGAPRIIIVPFFLAPGMHVRRDLVAILDSARRRHGIPIELADFFGAHPGVPQLLVDITQAAVARSGDGGASP